MNVNPVFASVGSFLNHKPIYKVPKYQRSYAWDKLEIEDFVKDLQHSFQKRKAGAAINHFFGGIVSVERSVAGTVNQSEFELVDGQQRMATFILLASSIIAVYKTLLTAASAAGDMSNISIIEGRIKELKQRFIEFEQEVNRRRHTVEVLMLSRSDEQAFRDIVRQIPITPTRASHYKLMHAYDEILKTVENLSGTTTLTDKLDNLEILKELIDGDFSLIHIKTSDEREAYTLFRVLNDRGKSLTDGDLLRARTLELLEGHSSQQASAETLWDEILADEPKVTEEYMRWIYSSFKGARPGVDTLFDDYLDLFYPAHRQSSVSVAEADAVLRSTQTIFKEIQNCRKLTKGEWPYSLLMPLTQWDSNRLDLLIKELRLTITMPILLAACHLPQQSFSEIIQVVERFMFRFKLIGNQHITPAINIFHSEAVIIRGSISTYNPVSLRNLLHTLQLSKVNDSLFKRQLETLAYKDGGGNQTLKYFLMTIEYYLGWYRLGAIGEPACRDKTRIYTFSATTIEHIYPKNAHGAVINPNVEPLKNSLGNLTFMGPADNQMGGNDGFAIKKSIFIASSVSMNNEIGENAHWSEIEVTDRANELKDIACIIFNI